jgi:hypothetical protein
LAWQISSTIGRAAAEFVARNVASDACWQPLESNELRIRDGRPYERRHRLGRFLADRATGGIAGGRRRVLIKRPGGTIEWGRRRAWVLGQNRSFDSGVEFVDRIIRERVPITLPLSSTRRAAPG